MEQSSKYTPQDGDISVFVNDKTSPDGTTNPKRPDYTGNTIINGEKFRVKLWKTVAKSSGNVFLSGKVEPLTVETTQEEKAKIDAFTL